MDQFVSHWTFNLRK